MKQGWAQVELFIHEEQKRINTAFDEVEHLIEHCQTQEQKEVFETRLPRLEEDLEAMQVAEGWLEDARKKEKYLTLLLLQKLLSERDGEIAVIVKDAEQIAYDKLKGAKEEEDAQFTVDSQEMSKEEKQAIIDAMLGGGS